jgi:hypothetical protein
LFLYQFSSNKRFYFLIDDPWILESNGRTTTTTASNDPWLGSTLTTSHVNPWNGNNQTVATNDNSLSVNISDPWGLGATNSRPPPPTTVPSASTNLIDNELSDFFGGSTAISSSYDQQQNASSNPWNITASSMNTNSISPSYTNISTGNNGGNFLYPTITSANNSSPLSTSASRKTPESFLGDKFSTLVNLDKLVTDPKSTNPFGSTPSRTPNPFSSSSKPPTLDQLTTSNTVPFSSGSSLPPPLIPSSLNTNNTTVSSFNTNNPFM